MLGKYEVIDGNSDPPPGIGVRRDGSFFTYRFPKGERGAHRPGLDPHVRTTKRSLVSTLGGTSCPTPRSRGVLYWAFTLITVS